MDTSIPGIEDGGIISISISDEIVVKTNERAIKYMKEIRIK